MGQEEDPPTNLSNHGRKGRASSPLVKYLEMGVFLSRSASDLPSFGASVSILSRRAIAPCGRRKISLRKKINFRAHEKIFSCAQKFPRVRTPIFRLPHGEFFACARAGIFAYTEIFFRICRNKFPYIQKFPSAYRAHFQRAQKRAPRPITMDRAGRTAMRG